MGEEATVLILSWMSQGLLRMASAYALMVWVQGDFKMRKNVPLGAAIVLASSLLFGGAAPTSDADAISATVHQFGDAMNKGDTKTAFAQCAAQVSIIDEFPPHAWQGTNACQTWGNDFDAYNKKNAVTDPIATIGFAARIDIEGDRAYAVFPASYAYKKAGKSVKEPGAKLTVALQKTGGAWRMTGWAWTRR